MAFKSVSFQIKSESVYLLDNAVQYRFEVGGSMLFGHCCKLYKYLIAWYSILN